MSNGIHPTAIVHPQAELAENVEIGPYSIVEGGAKIGPGCVLAPHVFISGCVSMGANNTIGHGAVIGTFPQDLAFSPKTSSGVCIGERNVIREYCTIHRGTAEGTQTIVGSDNYLMCGVHLAHNVTLADRVIIANNCLLAGYVQVHERAFLGGGSVFHQHIRIGKLAMVKGGCGISQEIPPFVIASDERGVVGLNTVGLKRGGYTPEERREIKQAYLLFYKSGLNASQALQQAKQQSWGIPGQCFFDFIRRVGKLGILKRQSG